MIYGTFLYKTHQKTCTESAYSFFNPEKKKEKCICITYGRSSSVDPKGNMVTVGYVCVAQSSYLEYDNIGSIGNDHPISR